MFNLSVCFGYTEDITRCFSDFLEEMFMSSSIYSDLQLQVHFERSGPCSGTLVQPEILSIPSPSLTIRRRRRVRGKGGP